MKEKSNPKTTTLSVEVKSGFEFFIEHWARIEKLMGKYHDVLLFKNALVKSDPIFLSSKKTKNRFAKCTVEFESPLPWIMRQGKKPEECGDVYIDSMTFENKRNIPGAFMLEKIQKGALISGIAILKSGHKPVRNEGDEYRANWVYGDYVYTCIYEVKLEREAPKESTTSPYKEDDKYSSYYHSIPESQKVSDEDIRFDL